MNNSFESSNGLLQVVVLELPKVERPIAVFLASLLGRCLVAFLLFLVFVVAQLLVDL